VTKAVLKEAKASMQKVVESAKEDFGTIRTGRANPALLDRVMVDYYGVPTPLKQTASVSAPEPRLLVIQPWDKNSIKDVEKAIMKSDLGLTPTTDGDVIRIAIPQLSEERRKELVRLVRNEAEEHRVGVRNVRREANAKLKEMEKAGDISEDESRRTQDEVQRLTDDYIARVDELLKKKEEEIMEV